MSQEQSDKKQKSMQTDDWHSQALEILSAESIEQIETIRQLFSEYAKSLNFDLCFQDFDKELEALPGKYAAPDGRLMLALYDQKIAGCVGLWKVNKEVCEMKRLWVRPEFRGRKIGRELAEYVIEQAKIIGYSRMKLDTIDSMTAAIKLYVSLGFKSISAYRYNPVEGAEYMELDLK